MKLPFNIILSPILKPYLGRPKMFCHHPIFSMSIYYSYMYGGSGFLLSANYLWKHLGETPSLASNNVGLQSKVMLVHDLKVIVTAMGLVQYTCMVLGCYTMNPSLFLPLLFGQLIVVAVMVFNVLQLLASTNFDIVELLHKILAILMLVFSWFQEFCVFRQCLCICDL